MQKLVRRDGYLILTARDPTFTKRSIQYILSTMMYVLFSISLL